MAKKKKNNKKMIFAVSVPVVFLVLLYFIFQWQSGKKVSTDGGKTLENPGQINLLFIGFKIKNFRWPANIVELENYLKENKEKGDYDLTAYQNLTFTETPQKTLKIHYDGYEKGNVTAGPYDAELNMGP